MYCGVETQEAHLETLSDRLLTQCFRQSIIWSVSMKTPTVKKEYATYLFIVNHCWNKPLT